MTRKLVAFSVGLGLLLSCCPARATLPSTEELLGAGLLSALPAVGVETTWQKQSKTEPAGVLDCLGGSAYNVMMPRDDGSALKFVTLGAQAALVL